MDEDIAKTLFGVPLESFLGHPLFRSAMRKVLEDEGVDPDKWEALRLRKRGPSPGYKARLATKKKRKG